METVLMRLYYEADTGLLCDCGEGPRDTRCIECHASRPTCGACFVRTHMRQPFHWAEVWNGEFFERKDYSQIGGMVYLGHHGLPCPARNPSGQPRSIIVAHTNCIHSVLLHYCECHNADEQWQQLLKHRLFPATIDRPSTVFTFELLSLSHRVCLRSKANTFDLADVLGHQTSEAFAHKVPVCTLCF